VIDFRFSQDLDQRVAPRLLHAYRETFLRAALVRRNLGGIRLDQDPPLSTLYGEEAPTNEGILYWIATS